MVGRFVVSGCAFADLGARNGEPFDLLPYAESSA
jgi:hypothetical protein